jgi:hypothetical protein
MKTYVVDVVIENVKRHQIKMVSEEKFKANSPTVAAYRAGKEAESRWKARRRGQQMCGMGIFLVRP